MTIQTEKKKALVLENLLKFNGNIRAACQESGVGKTTYYEWCQKDPEFKQAALDVQEDLLDKVEGYLFKGMEEGNPSLIIFYLKCRGKKRGYIEKQEIEVTNVPKIDFTDE